MPPIITSTARENNQVSFSFESKVEEHAEKSYYFNIHPITFSYKKGITVLFELRVWYFEPNDQNVYV